ncbi:EamA-like transporter family protein [Candidatus Erwinia haradaeae]|uniref:EamA-like transporter family protein, partial n=1 Tax=Candidatus Erwinia haradaeae TaxID=1922217 RepID=A0A451D0D5_9GAMM|nr:DMT family transporter [Candidatus Erwinia haradaeae]VFP78893.1 EamA-like transporter family protein [Candidatus Erwinia haradaeae]
MRRKIFHNLVIISLFTAVSFTWGTTWMAMKIAVSSVPPILATGLRFLFATPLLFLLSRYKQAPLLFPSSQGLFQLYVTLFYFALPFTLMIYGERYIASGLASIIFSIMPAIVLILSRFILNERTTTQQIVGLWISISTLIIILWQEAHHNNLDTQIRGVLALVAAVLIHAIMYVLCKKRCMTISVLSYNTLPCLGAGIILTIAGLSETTDVKMFSTQSLLAIAYLGIVASVGGVLAYFFLQKIIKPFQASLVFMIFPLIALTLERVINDSSLSKSSLVLLIPFLLGMILTLYKSKEKNSL